MSKSASQIKIERLTEHLENEKLARAIDQQRHKQELELEAQFRTSEWNELLADFPELKYLVKVCRYMRAAAIAQRGAPSEDTMRVGHPELNSVEAAADWPGHLSAARSRMKWADGEIRKLAERLDDDLSAAQDRKVKAPKKPRCRRRGCAAYDKALPYGSKACSVCQEPLPEAA